MQLHRDFTVVASLMKRQVKVGKKNFSDDSSCLLPKTFVGMKIERRRGIFCFVYEKRQRDGVENIMYGKIHTTYKSKALSLSQGGFVLG